MRYNHFNDLYYWRDMVLQRILSINYVYEALLSFYFVSVIIPSLFINFQIMITLLLKRSSKLHFFFLLSTADIVVTIIFAVYFINRSYYGVRFTRIYENACLYFWPCMSWGLKFSLSMIFLIHVSRILSLSRKTPSCGRDCSIVVIIAVLAFTIVISVLINNKTKYRYEKFAKYTTQKGFTFTQTTCRITSSDIYKADILINFVIIIIVVAFSFLMVLFHTMYYFKHFQITVWYQTLILALTATVQAILQLPVLLYYYQVLDHKSYDESIMMPFEDLLYVQMTLAKIGNGISFRVQYMWKVRQKEESLLRKQQLKRKVEKMLRESKRRKLSTQ